MNNKQSEFLRQYGLTEEKITSGEADPAHRLNFANLALVADEPVDEEPAPVEETAEQKAYRGDRPQEQLTSPGDIENYEALGTGIFKKTEAEVPVKVAKPLPEEPVVVGPHSDFDYEKIAALSPWRRNEIDGHIRVVKNALKANATLGEQWSLDQARQHLAPYVLRK
ncbi:hypothetical protein [Mesorhizobium sp. M0965]|uniref:hypothetical protein n=1 Tax=Mesorhizobium sp. M0965 TaxID=2957036 RepID=UPI00333DA2AF